MGFIEQTKRTVYPETPESKCISRAFTPVLRRGDWRPRRCERAGHHVSGGFGVRIRDHSGYPDAWGWRARVLTNTGDASARVLVNEV